MARKKKRDSKAWDVIRRFFRLEKPKTRRKRKTAAERARDQQTASQVLPEVLEDSGLTNARELTEALSTAGMSPAAAEPTGHRGPPIIPGARSVPSAWTNLPTRPYTPAPSPTPIPTPPQSPGLSYDDAGALLPPRWQGGNTGGGGGNSQQEAQEEIIIKRRRQRQKEEETAMDMLTKAFQKLTRAVLGPTLGNRVNSLFGGQLGPSSGPGQGASPYATQAASDAKGMTIDGIKGFGKMIGGKAGMALLTGGMFATAVGGTIYAFLKIREAGLKLADAQVESLRPLSRFNAQIASAFLQADYQEKLRLFNQGGANAASSERLIKEWSAMKDSMQPMKTAMTEAYNNTAATILGYLRGYQETFNQLPWIKDILADIKKKADEAMGKNKQAFTGFFQDVLKGAYNKKPGE